jgi:hypothetical protein
MVDNKRKYIMLIMRKNQLGYTVIDVLFAIVMPTLIVLAIVVAFSKSNIQESAPISTDRLSHVEPTVDDFWEINVTDGRYNNQYSTGDYAEQLIFYENNQLVYSEDNISDNIFVLDTNRGGAQKEFYTRMSSELFDAGFELISGANTEKILIEDTLGFASLYEHKNIKRTCLLNSNNKVEMAQLICADNREGSVNQVSSFAENNFSKYLEDGNIYIHERFGKTYYGSEPKSPHNYEYAEGLLSKYKLVDDVPILQKESILKVVFWRINNSNSWELFIEDDNLKSDVTIICSSIAPIHSEALPNKVCLDDNGGYAFLGAYYAN